MYELEMKYTEENLKLPSKESHPMTDPLGENKINPVKKQVKSVLKPNQTNNNKHNMLISYK